MSASAIAQAPTKTDPGAARDRGRARAAVARRGADGAVDFAAHGAPAEAKATPGVAWDFSRVQILPPDQTDPLEREAERVGEQFTRTVEPEGAVPIPRPGRAEWPNSARDLPSVVREVLRSPGQPLDAVARAYFEPRFGHDFSAVRVHTDANAAASAKALSARAFTVGRHVVIGSGDPGLATGTGRQLMAHELAHVVQQGDEAVPRRTLVPLASTNRTPRAAGLAVAAGLPRVHVSAATGVGLARAEGDDPHVVPTPSPARPYIDIVTDIHAAEGVLEDLKREAENLIDEVLGEIHRIGSMWEQRRVGSNGPGFLSMSRSRPIGSKIG